MKTTLLAVLILLASGCSTSDPDAVNEGEPAGPAGGPDAAGPPDGGGAPGTPGSDAGGGGASGEWRAGSLSARCKGEIPAEGQPVDVTAPASVVGAGTPASCTYEALASAVAKGGIITFDCGSEPVTIGVTATLDLKIDRDTVIDGGKKITLDGQNKVQILRFHSPDWMKNDHGLTLQRIALVNGKTTPEKAIPPAPAPCSQGFNDGEGGALFMRDGNLTVIDSIFAGNHAAPLGPDTGGGAVYVMGSKRGTLIVKSTFEDNEASNAGALGGLFSEHRVYDSLFRNNKAVGNGANRDDASKCSAINNGQHEIGSGGNGGAIYSDGTGKSVYLCGDEITGNAAGVGAFGGGVFFTSNDMTGDLSILDSTITGNTGGHWTNAATGSVHNAGTAVGTNCHNITVQDSTLQGYP